ncbi:MAG TPA: DNA repair protein RecN [Candidatus Acidoferrales bacterium]|nr:DNA repair protein RecN [Candidatus Acidoferrales bacterium]
MRLRRLEIEDFGLIARAELRFADGFTVCSGETGSGKTMLLGALGFVLGARASPENIRRGAARTRVTLEIEPDETLRALAAETGFELEPDEDAIVSRELTQAGKSSARVNGRPAAAGQLRELGERILDFVGQHEQQRLLSPAYQLDLLDRFAGEAALVLRDRVGVAHVRTAQLTAALSEAQHDAGRTLAEYEYARFAVDEIDAANLQLDEEMTLRTRREYLVHAEKIAGALALAHDALVDGDGAAGESLGAAVAALAGVQRFAPSLEALGERLRALQGEVTEAAAVLAHERERTEYDAGEAESIGARLDLLDRLKRKYGGSMDAVLAERSRLHRVLDDYDSRDERLAALASERESAQRELAMLAAALTAMRTQAAHALELAVAQELRALAMPSARFAVGIEPVEPIGARGTERVEFALAPNPGEPLRPLARAASGGELSRVLLALVVVLADRRERTTLVFDEIDAGIGGATANAVGLRLGALARSAQILCVTHLAQIASWADAHYALRKRVEGETTQIEVLALDQAPAIREEIARMLSGNAAAVALDHAETLLAEVRQKKVSATSG